jgi:hypothetical protein
MTALERAPEWLRNKTFESPVWFRQVLPLIGWIARELARQEIAPLLRRIDELENYTKDFTYRGVWHEGTYKRGNFVTHGGGVWHCNADTVVKPGTDPVAWTLSVKKGRDAEPRLPTRGGARPQTTVERRT